MKTPIILINYKPNGEQWKVKLQCLFHNMLTAVILKHINHNHLTLRKTVKNNFVAPIAIIQ